jgi:hypothetical protein
MGRGSVARLSFPETELHIVSVPLALPPYALATPIFRFRSLASLAGRAPIGGAREVALACFVTARLALECTVPVDDDPSTRSGRATAAKGWLGTLALPATVRTVVNRCADLTVDGSRQAVGREVAALAVAASSFLDAPSRAELEALAGLLDG